MEKSPSPGIAGAVRYAALNGAGGVGANVGAAVGRGAIVAVAAATGLVSAVGLPASNSVAVGRGAVGLPARIVVAVGRGAVGVTTWDAGAASASKSLPK